MGTNTVPAVRRLNKVPEMVRPLVQQMANIVADRFPDAQFEVISVNKRESRYYIDVYTRPEDSWKMIDLITTWIISLRHDKGIEINATPMDLFKG